MQPLDPEKKPASMPPRSTTSACGSTTCQGRRMAVGQWRALAPGGIRKVRLVTTSPSLHPKGNEEFPIGGEGVLIELVQAPKEVVDAFAKLAGN